MRCSASCGWESGYTRNWTPSSSRNPTDPSRFQTLPRLPSVGRTFTQRLLSRFKTLSSKEWLERHGNVSPEELERNPTRNRLAVLLGRTNHASYHFGQMMLAKPKTP